MRIVLKIGSGVLTCDSGLSLDHARFGYLADDVASCHRAGHSCVIVSSGAIAAGVAEQRLDGRPEDLPGKQACAAIGQPILMRAYATSLASHGLRPAQLLLTHDDIDSRIRRTNASNTLERLLAMPGVIPIINENDSVATEELRFGDNDRLSAEVAIVATADLLILLTCAEGVLDQGVRVPRIETAEAAKHYVTGETGRWSVGGMAAKLDAVALATQGGIETVIADGRRPGQITGVVAGSDVGTRFPAHPRTPLA